MGARVLINGTWYKAAAALLSQAMRWWVGCLRLEVNAAVAAFTALLTPEAPDSEIRPVMLPFCGLTRSNSCSLPSAILPSTKAAKTGSAELVTG